MQIARSRAQADATSHADACNQGVHSLTRPVQEDKRPGCVCGASAQIASAWMHESAMRGPPGRREWGVWRGGSVWNAVLAVGVVGRRTDTAQRDRHVLFPAGQQSCHMARVRHP